MRTPSRPFTRLNAEAAITDSGVRSSFSQNETGGPRGSGPKALLRSLLRLRRLCEEAGLEPLRRRGLLAPPDFLIAA